MKTIYQKSGKIFTLIIYQDFDYEYNLSLSIFGIRVLNLDLHDVFDTLKHKITNK